MVVSGFRPKTQLGLRMRASVIVTATGNDQERYTHTRVQHQRDQEVQESEHDRLTPNE